MGIKSVKQQGLGGLDITLLKSQGNLATGGSIANLNGYRIHIFNSTATFNALLPLNVEYLIVAGGGAGGVGSTPGGGGGGGSLWTGGSVIIVSSSSTKLSTKFNFSVSIIGSADFNSIPINVNNNTAKILFISFSKNDGIQKAWTGSAYP